MCTLLTLMRYGIIPTNIFQTLNLSYGSFKHKASRSMGNVHVHVHAQVYSYVPLTIICNHGVEPLTVQMYIYMHSVGAYKSIIRIITLCNKHCCPFQERAFLGVSTLKELVLKRPQGPESTESFLQALLEVTMGHIELVGNNHLHY